MSFSGRTRVSKTRNEGSIPSTPAIIATMPDFQLNFLGINTTNFEVMLRFYTQVMQLAIKHSKPGWAAFQTKGTKLELFETNKIDQSTASKNPTRAPVFIGFETKNIHQAFDWIRSQKIPIAKNLATHRWGLDFYFKDPDGNMIQIAQYT